MTIQGRDLSLGRSEVAGNQTFVKLISRHGFTALMIELGILAAATIAAIGTDDYWSKRGQDSDQNEQGQDPDSETPLKDFREGSP